MRVLTTSPTRYLTAKPTAMWMFLGTALLAFLASLATRDFVQRWNSGERGAPPAAATATVMWLTAGLIFLLSLGGS